MGSSCYIAEISKYLINPSRRFFRNDECQKPLLWQNPNKQCPQFSSQLVGIKTSGTSEASGDSIKEAIFNSMMEG